MYIYTDDCPVFDSPPPYCTTEQMFTTAFMFTTFCGPGFLLPGPGFFAILKEFFLSVNGNALPRF